MSNLTQSFANDPQFKFERDTIREDGLVNITALATAYTKATGTRCNITEWLGTREANASIAYLASYSNIPQSELVKVVRGGKAGGTWVHSDLAEIFAQWISVEYRFAVVHLIRLAKSPQSLTQMQMISAMALQMDAQDKAAAAQPPGPTTKPASHLDEVKRVVLL